ncbi:MAG: hypothetical protein LBU41_02570, partial [Clostridiales Family XIII bacterium]|nr:hypothetical protein [Clostridiales Family XIII bacterium]
MSKVSPEFIDQMKCLYSEDALRFYAVPTDMRAPLPEETPLVVPLPTQQTQVYAENPVTSHSGREGKSRRLRSCIVGFFFYLFLAVSLLLVYTFAGTGSGPPRHILGWTAMTVLTRSMQSEIPQDSLIVTYHCDPAQLKVGDNATYLISETTTITHKIIAIETGS